VERDGKPFRLMRYVIRVDNEHEVRLHNVVTGQLVILDQNEAEMLGRLPLQYCPQMEQLVDDHFLVADDYDEHQQVVNIRSILRKLDAAKPKGNFRHYIILPTTACNARCYYCFEHGVKTVTMTKDTADKVTRFIANNSQDHKKISIMWFGGEPTVAANRIDQISAGLQDREIPFQSTMVSNAYLFDEEMVTKAKTLWNLQRIQISVDGMEDHYNEIKSFVNAGDNPFERVMRNIGLLLDAEIQVDLRMNYDLNNHMDFNTLLDYAKKRFGNNRKLQVYAYPVIGEYPDKSGELLHGNDEWREHRTVELNEKARESGLFSPKRELPYLHYTGCGADDDNSITINAQGLLVECPEHFDETQTVGNLSDGITNVNLIQEWKKIADHEKCSKCVFFPRCVRLVNCSAGDKCYFQDRNRQYYDTIRSYSAISGIQIEKEEAIS